MQFKFSCSFNPANFYNDAYELHKIWWITFRHFKYSPHLIWLIGKLLIRIVREFFRIDRNSTALHFNVAYTIMISLYFHCNQIFHANFYACLMNVFVDLDWWWFCCGFCAFRKKNKSRKLHQKEQRLVQQRTAIRSVENVFKISCEHTHTHTGMHHVF